MVTSDGARRSLRERFHDVNNALQGLSNLIATLRRDQVYTREVGDLMTVAFDKVQERLENLRAEVMEEGKAAPSRNVPTSLWGVLLVDPDPLSRRMSAARLTALGHEVTAVDSETAALKAVREKGDFGAAVIDCVDETGTIRLSRALRGVAPRLEIILSCHESHDPPSEEALGFTPVGVLQKPLKAHRVAELMSRIGRRTNGETAH